MTVFSCNVLNVNSVKCISIKNQKCKIKTIIIDVNNNDPTFYHFSVSVNKCSGSNNNIIDPYATFYVPGVVKNKNVKVIKQGIKPGMKLVNVNAD